MLLLRKTFIWKFFLVSFLLRFLLAVRGKLGSRPCELNLNKNIFFSSIICRMYMCVYENRKLMDGVSRCKLHSFCKCAEVAQMFKRDGVFLSIRIIANMNTYHFISNNRYSNDLIQNLCYKCLNWCPILKKTSKLVPIFSLY